MKEKKFRNRIFNHLYEFMKEMDFSDDYLMIQVSSLDLGNEKAEMNITVTGMKKGNDSVREDDAVRLLTDAMRKSAQFKRVVTKAAKKCEQLDNCSWMVKP